jgi:hypothetical protein
MYIIFLYQIFQKTVSFVGDRKSYDHLIKLKSEYGGSLSWVLPYPGDWPILFLISFSIKLIII